MAYTDIHAEASSADTPPTWPCPLHFCNSLACKFCCLGLALGLLVACRLTSNIALPRDWLIDALSPLGSLGDGVAGGEGAIYLWARLPPGWAPPEYMWHA